MTRENRAAVSALNDVRLSIEYVAVERLCLPDRAVRVHSQRQIKALGKSLRDFGAIIPVVIDRNDVVFVGAAVVQAAAQIGVVELPTVRITHLDDHQLRLFRIAHTKLSDGGSWDLDALRIEFADIAMERPEVSLCSSGFSIPERDIIFGRHRASEMVDLDDQPALSSAPPVSRLGDRWRLGRHVVVNGDATDSAVIARAVDGQMVRTVASDLPYNVKIDGNVSGRGQHQHGDFAMASGEMDRERFTAFLRQALGATQPHLHDGALLYLFMDWRHLLELQAAAEESGLSYLNLLVWAKSNAGMGSLYRSAHEMIGVFKHGHAPHINNVELGRHGRNRTNVIHMPGVNGFGKGRGKALAAHPTVKPVGMMADLILDSSGPGDLILDPFGGSGTTLIAAEKTDRTAALVEYDSGYVDVICRRYEALTGTPAVHAESGATFAETAKVRIEEAR